MVGLRWGLGGDEGDKPVSQFCEEQRRLQQRLITTNSWACTVGCLVVTLAFDFDLIHV